MNEYAKGIFELSKACSVRKLTASGLISHKPCFVFFITTCPNNGGLVYEGAVHNGETSSAEVLIDIKGLYGQNKHNPQVPMYFNKGIYLAITANITSITIQYLEEDK